MTETLTGRQVLALLAQDEVPEIEYQIHDKWRALIQHEWSLAVVLSDKYPFRIKPAPQQQYQRKKIDAAFKHIIDNADELGVDLT